MTGSVERAADVLAGGVRVRGASGRSCGAGCGRGGRCRATRCRARSSRSSSATAAATAATSCTSGVAVLFVGVAASSAFQDARDVELQVGQTAQGRRLRGHLPAADGRARGGEQRPAREDRPRRGDARLARRRAGRHAAHRALVLPLRRPDARARCRASSRARRRARSACAPGCGATSGARSRRTCATCASRSRRATASSRPPRTLPAEQREIALARGARRPDALLRGEPAARHLPPDRLAAGELDLDRRPDRVRGRPDRPLAARCAAPRGRSRPATRRAWRASSAAR